MKSVKSLSKADNENVPDITTVNINKLQLGNRCIFSFTGDIVAEVPTYNRVEFDITFN